MKRAIAWLVILAGVVPPVEAAKRLSAAEFEHALADFRGKPDAEAAFRIADVELTERLGGSRLARLNAMLTGEKSRQALMAVADASEFQPPASDEIPAAAAPDLATQRRIMKLVVAYVTKAIPQLPNFIATRTTDRFEDTPQRLRGSLASSLYEPLHFVARAQSTELYRDNREVEDAVLDGKKQSPVSVRGLRSRGEFGAILSTVLLDAAQNQLGWLRWEKGEAGALAVFAYFVPKEKSHFELNYCCVDDSEGRSRPFNDIAGYKGQMLVDPATGTILRLEVVADLKAGDPISSAKIAVEYGSVNIGGRAYICPLHGVALSRAQGISHEKQEMVQAAPHGAGGAALAPVVVGTTPEVRVQTLLNDVAFTEYHVFRAESRMIAGTPADLPSLGLSSAQPVASAAQLNSSGVPAPEPAAASETKTPSGSDLTAAADLPAAAEKPEPHPIPEISLEAKTELPDSPLKPQEPGDSSGFRLRTTTRLVDVGLMAYDKKERPITDLKQGDFEVYDNGRKQEIKYFGQAGPPAAPSSATPPALATGRAPDPVYSNRQAAPALEPRPAALESHATILLIDSANLAWPDLQHARQEMLRFLKTVPADEPVGLYILRGFGFQILLEPAADHGQIANTLTHWMPDARDLQKAQDEERLNRQQIDSVHRKEDLTRVNGHQDPTDPDSGTMPVDPQLRDWGRAPGQDALSLLVGVARHLAALSGHKNLIWVASDNVLADWSGRSVNIEKNSTSIEPFTLHAQEAMNEAHVSVYPLDASQLEGGAITADAQNRNVKVNPTSPMLPTPGQQGPGGSGGKAITSPSGEDISIDRDMKPGRVTAAMQQDLHVIQGPIRELAEATGGRALRRAGDIAGELNGIAEDGRAAYLISFTPDGPADGKYHLITVKLAGRRDVKLRYRTGYLYEKEPVTLKERFQRAIWQPHDGNDIALTATPDRIGQAAALKLTIAATDLEIAQKGDRWTDRVDIFLVERDDAALYAKYTSHTLGLRLLPATYQKALRDGIQVDQPLPAKSTGGSYRIVVIDENSGRMGSVTVPASALPRPAGSQ